MPVPIEDYCGVPNVSETGVVNRKTCCGHEKNLGITKGKDCDMNNEPQGDAYPAVQMFLKDEKNWLNMFHKAWYVATTNGYYQNG